MCAKVMVYRSVSSEHRNNIDIPAWLSLLIVFAVSASIPASLVFFSSDYLSSERGFADGGDMYSHITEALYIKEQFQCGETNLWYDSVTLGYPMYIAYQPLPSLVAATTMVIFERYVQSSHLFNFAFFHFEKKRMVLVLVQSN